MNGRVAHGVDEYVSERGEISTGKGGSFVAN